MVIKNQSYIKVAYSQEFSLGWGGGSTSAGRFLQLSNKNNVFYAYFRQNNYLKATTHQ